MCSLSDCMRYHALQVCEPPSSAWHCQQQAGWLAACPRLVNSLQGQGASEIDQAWGVSSGATVQQVLATKEMKFVINECMKVRKGMNIYEE